MTATQRSILAVAMLTQGVSVGLTYALLPVFLEPLEQAFDAPRTQIASGQILMMFALTLGSLATGAALDRGWARRVMVGGACLMGLAQLVASFAPNLWVLALAALMAGFSVPSIGPIAGATLVTRFFDAERGRAMGLMAMGPPLGSGFFAFLAGWALLSFDWREVFLGFSFLAVVVLVPVIWFIVPSRFEDVPSTGEGAQADVTMADVLKMPRFWWAAGVFALAAGISSGWAVHVVAYLGGLGFNEAEASSVFAVQNWLGVPGAIFFGMLSDRVDITKLFSSMLLLASACYAALAFGPSPLAVTIVCAVFGFAFGGTIPLYMILLGKRMGPAAMGRAMGLSNLVMLPLMASVVVFAASDYESSGGYAMSLLVFSAGMLGAIGCVLGSMWSARTA